MKRLFVIVLTVFSMLTISQALAAEKTVKLSVPGMNCPSCPFMVQSVISSVPGVKSVDASLEDRTAVVVFDDVLAMESDLTEATGKIGYPSTVIRDGSNS